MPTRDEFSEKVKRTVGQRAAYLCSNPECRDLTIRPHSQPGESLSTGVAAHICAASPGGPRFDPSQTENTRKSISNAIWLCHKCSDLIDKDSHKYTKEVMLDWRSQHDKYISDGGGLRKLPEIKLTTQKGLTLLDLPSATIQGNDIAAYREHVLSIYNPNSRAIAYFDCRIQFPEPIVHYFISDSPVGAAIKCNPDRMNMVANVSGSSSVTIRGRRPALDYKVAVDAVPPKGRLEFRFLSVESPTPVGYPSKLSDGAIEYHILGKFQYLFHGEYLPRNFLIPLEFDAENRNILSLPCEEYDGTRKVLYRQIVM